MGLAEVRSGWTRNPADSFTEAMKSRKAYNESPSGQREQKLRLYAQLFQQMLNDSCLPNQAEIQKLFDKWVLYVDPNIDNPAQRNRGTDADTWYSTTTTRFNYWFFSAQSQGFSTFAHEFRHTMDANNQLVKDRSKHVKNRLTNNPMIPPHELDANEWSKMFQNCSCQ